MLIRNNMILFVCVFFWVGFVNSVFAENNESFILEPSTDGPWMGYDFVFCFVTDDGQLSNSAWVDLGYEMDFRFTIAVNSAYRYWNKLTGEQLNDFWEGGFEIANHSYSHGDFGLPETCPKPPNGSLAGYFKCEDVDLNTAMMDFTREIERDSVVTHANIPVESVTSFAYPRNIHTKAIIDSLITEGYTGARIGSRWHEEEMSYGDFTTYPYNGWDEGISLFRVPTTISGPSLFGDHSANPPVHKSYNEFREAADPWIEVIKNKSGVFVLYAHHLGDDDDSLGDINYEKGGVSTQDLEWIVELVRDNGGVVMTFGEMCRYYRERTTMVNIDGDYVWQLPQSPVEDVVVPNVMALKNYPNPFNPRTVVAFSLVKDCKVNLSVFDQAGRLVKTLDEGLFESGEHRRAWNGTDSNGRSVPSGQYFLKIKADGRVASHKMLLLR